MFSLRGNAQRWTLLHLRYTKHIFAGDGVPGGKNQLTGAAGEDVYIDVPLGTVAFHAEDHTQMGEITEDGPAISHITHSDRQEATMVKNLTPKVPGKKMLLRKVISPTKGGWSKYPQARCSP